MSPAPVIDIHAHYYPETFLALVEKEGERHGARYATDNPLGPMIHVAGDLPSGPATPEFVRLDLRLAAMDRQGVTVQALSLTQPMVYFGDAGFAGALAQTFNDAASAAHRAHPGRFVALATLPLTHPDAALRELERAARLPGVRGVYFGTNTGTQELSDRSLFPIYEAIEALALPIFLHPVRQVGFDRLAPWFMRNLLGNPFENALAAAHLIFGGVLDAFPRLEICLPHAGGALPIIAGRMDRGHAVSPQCAHLPRPPSDYLRRFHFDTIGHSPTVMRYLLDLVGPERVMLGSDYCFAMGYERPVEVVTRIEGLDAAARSAILGGNAARLLKLG